MLSFLPLVDALLESLVADRILLLAIDRSEVGRKCLALMGDVIYEIRCSTWQKVSGSTVLRWHPME